MPDVALPARPSRSQGVLDDLIMGTNSSSIVSKRSVERLYYPNEPHYFRYFVKKPQRRAPLINRGYWLRLKAIDVVVRQFLSRPSSNKKVVVNLGCGSDVLPWQCYARYPDSCENALFVDVDYPDLMLRKRTIVRETPELRQPLGPDASFSDSHDEPILLKSPSYCQVACDLRQLETLHNALGSLISLQDADVLFVAEVSITYMDTLSADSLIEWASSIGKAEFCLLEQILPEGADHPFAKTMLSHFNKLKTPIKSVHQYPTLGSQRVRFESRGWAHVDLWDLWEAWSSGDFISSAERRELDIVEPFDEWEEFIMFSRHYCVLHARATPTPNYHAVTNHPGPPISPIRSSEYKVTAETQPKPIKRRFGNAMILSNAEGQQYGVHMLGLGADSRTDSYDIYSLGSTTAPFRLPLRGPTTRMCSTLTSIGVYGTLLAGGRGSPSKASSDCWILKKGASGITWEKTRDLPIPLFRHAATRLGRSSLVLVMGGKSGPCRISDINFVFHPERGWQECVVVGKHPEPAFGGVVCNARGPHAGDGSFRGLRFGGIRADGTLCPRIYSWKLDLGHDKPFISFEDITRGEPTYRALSVFGAEVVELGHCTAICGGTGAGAHHQGQTITFISTLGSECNIVDTLCAPLTEKEPLFMIGSSAFLNGNGITVVGGGATCFSMGTYWETKTFQVSLPDKVLSVIERVDRTERSTEPTGPALCKYLESPRILPGAGNELLREAPRGTATIIQIPRVKLEPDGCHFERLLREGKPAILEGLQLGECIEKWTENYMADRVGKDKEVVVHECEAGTENMDFNSKNFQYITDSFARVVSRIHQGARLYLRSLSHDKPSHSPANIDQDFPEISRDFSLPDELGLVTENLFSSVLRLSGRVNMWLHYDVMANVYAQIRGSKRMILFPPSDVSHLGFAPGASSSSLDVFSSLDSPTLSATHPHEATLGPGDVLLLPPMWLHTASPTSDMSVAVNIFFRDMAEGYAAGRDVYGNRDLEAYERGRQDAARIGRSFEKLPREIQRFYLSRLADELRGYAERS